MAKQKPDYTQAQKLRDMGKSILEVAEITGLNRDGIGRNTVKTVPVKLRVKPKEKPAKLPKLKKKKVSAPKEGNQDKLYKGEAKVKDGLKVFKTRKGQDDGKRKVQINRNTWIFTDKETDELAIKEFNERYSL